RRLSCCTLFPYTTLFRSVRVDELHFDCGTGGRRAVSEADPNAGPDHIASPLRLISRVDGLDVNGFSDSQSCHERVVPPIRGPVVDRKSTRLNSSHDQISY